MPDLSSAPSSPALSRASSSPRVSTDPSAFAHTAIATSPGSTTGTGAVPSWRVPWKPLVIGGVLVMVIATIMTHCGSTSREPLASDPGVLHVVPPEGLEANPRAARDWNKVVEQLDKGHVGEAKEKLDEWEERWGPTPETGDLRKQLDALPDDVPLERGHGRGKHGH